MIGTKCPGQDMRYWTADDVHEDSCPQCGEMIEFFKTDIRLRCPSCKARVANPRFDMGCAQWCAYAEQCLGPGARGLKSKSLRAILEDELDRRSGNITEKVAGIKEIIEEAEKKCEKEHVDMFPVVASIIISFLKTEELIEDPSAFLDELEREHSLPQRAVKETKAILERLGGSGNGGPDDPAYSLVEDLLADFKHRHRVAGRKK